MSERIQKNATERVQAASEREQSARERAGVGEQRGHLEQARLHRRSAELQADSASRARTLLELDRDLEGRPAQRLVLACCRGATRRGSPGRRTDAH